MSELEQQFYTLPQITYEQYQKMEGAKLSNRFHGHRLSGLFRIVIHNDQQYVLNLQGVKHETW